MGRGAAGCDNDDDDVDECETCGYLAHRMCEEMAREKGRDDDDRPKRPYIVEEEAIEGGGHCVCVAVP